jgi:hypothetical protein
LILFTVKGARGKVSFDSQTDKYASQQSSDASPEAYLSLRKSVFVILEVRCDKYASGEAEQDNFEAYMTFRELNDTLPRAPFTVLDRYEVFFPILMTFSYLNSFEIRLGQ